VAIHKEAKEKRNSILYFGALLEASMSFIFLYKIKRIQFNLDALFVFICAKIKASVL